jgi:DNA repair exonuclease SbcCD ATPase subunit
MNNESWKDSFVSKSSLIALFLTAMISKVSSASNTQGRWGGQISFLDAINPWLVYPITSWADFGIFIAMTLGFYFATLPLLNEIYSFMLDHFPTSNRSSRFGANEEGVPIGVKGLSATSAFVTAQAVGWILGGLGLIIITLLSVLVPVIFYAYQSGSFLRRMPGFTRNAVQDAIPGADSSRDNGTTTSSSPSSSPGSNGPDVSALQDSVSQVESELSNIENMAKGVDQELRKIVREEQDLESMKSELGRMVNGNKLSREEAEQLSHIIDETEEVEQLEEKVENFVENVINEEEHIAELEEHISRLEADMESGEADISQVEEFIDQKLQQLESELEAARNEMESLRAEQEQQGEVDPEEYSAKHQDIEEKARSAHRGAQELSQRIAGVMDKAGRIEEEASGTENEIEEAEAEVADVEGKSGQVDEPVSREKSEIEDEEQRTEALPERDVPTALVEAEEDEQQVAAEEEKEAEDIKDLAGKEEQIVAAEEQELAMLENVLGSQETQLKKYSEEAQEIAKRSEQQLNQLQQMGQTEQRANAYMKRNITQLENKLRNVTRRLRDGKISEKEAVNEIKAAQHRLEEIRKQTQNDKELNRILDMEDLTETLFGRIQSIGSEEAQMEKESQHLAIEAQQFARTLQSGQEQNAIKKARESFDDAGQVWFNPNKQKSIQQAEGWIDSREEVLEGLERIQQNHKGDRQKVQEAQRLEEGLVIIINNLCEERGIDRSQFGFLP